MRTILILSLLLVLGLTTYSFVRPRYQAQVCGNLEVNYWEVQDAIDLVHKQGCQDAIVYQIPDDTAQGKLVVYGIKIVAPVY